MTDAQKAEMLPALEAGGYLIEAMMRLGPTRPTGFGERATDWPEIDAFARLTGRVAEAWEAEALHAMCAAYAVEYAAAVDPLRMPPAEREREKG